MTTDWLPYELMTAGQRSMVRWIHPGPEPRLLEPFFRKTVQKLITENSVQKLTPLADLAHIKTAKTPRGFIFHVSRCGSTLVSRSLAAVARHRVISEATSVNQLLLVDDLDWSQKAPLLKGLIHALCGTADNVDCFIKFSSWNLLFLEQILALFPDTPWVFVYRDPVDVLQSLTARPPSWADNVRMAEAGGHSPASGTALIPHMLDAMFKAPLTQLNPLAKIINYSQLPAAMDAIIAHFGLELTPEELADVDRMGQYDAKQSGEVKFRARERSTLSPELNEALQPLNRLYQQWENLRGESEQSHVA